MYHIFAHTPIWKGHADKFSGGNVLDRGDRPSPKESATLYDAGTSREGQDGNMWHIIITSNGTHRWAKGPGNHYADGGNVLGLTKEDVLGVAKDLSFVEPTDEQVREVLSEVDAQAEHDPTGTWRVWIEDLLYEKEVPQKRFAGKKMADGGDTGSYEVELEAVPNEDFGKGSHEATISVKKHRVKAKDLKEVSRKTVEFIQKHDLGSGNFAGGDIYKGGKKIGQVSYNGRLWDNERKEMTEGHPHEARARAAGKLSDADIEKAQEVLRTILQEKDVWHRNDVMEAFKKKIKKIK